MGRLHNHNHGSVPSTGDQVIRMLNKITNRNLSYILDTGQYRGSPGVSEGKRGVDDNRWDFYESIRISVPKAVQVRAKIYRINSGKEKWLDYDRIMPIIINAGFNGWMSVVYEGQDELNEIEAVPKASKYLRDMLNTYGL